jgi:peptidoglycan/LPS O-acetylase OafA/YrhL
LGSRPALDGVRAVAVLAVLAFHFRADDHALPTRGGFLGVDIFFVLSGFLITTLLVEERRVTGSIRFGLFYIRRALRLLPALFAVVGLWLAWVGLFDRGVLHDARREAVAAVLYGENWYHALPSFHAGFPTGLSHTWSLSIEEQFYIVWPALLWLLLRVGARFAASATALGIVAVVVLRTVAVHDNATINRMYFSTQMRADSLLAGCLLALLLTQGVIRGRSATFLRRLSPPAALVVACLLVVAYQKALWLYRGGLTVFALATAVALYGVLECGLLGRLLEARPMIWIGRRSYGLYLWHWPIFIALLDHFGRAKIASSAGLVLTFIVAWASYRWLETPFLRLKRKRFTSTERAPEAVTHAPVYG